MQWHADLEQRVWSSDPRYRLDWGVPDSVSPGVRWEGFLRNSSGYGEEARGFVFGLARRGLDIGVATTDDDPAFPATLPAEDRMLLEQLLLRQPKYEDVVVQHLVPWIVGRRDVGGYQVARTMFETDSLPRDWLPNLSQVDEIWVPTPFNVTTFTAAGVRTPLHVVPAGVDPVRFSPDHEPWPWPTSAGTTFLAVSAIGSDSRSGWDVLLGAWADAFSRDDDVQLVLKVSPRPGTYEETMAALERWIDHRLADAGRTRAECAPVVLVGDLIPVADVPRIYAAADAVVAPLRGTAFGRPLLEAMSCRKPVIATRWSAIPDFLTDDNGYLIEIDGLAEISNAEANVDFRGHRWARPSRRSLVGHLLSIVSDPQEARRRAARARHDVLERWTWDHMVDIVQDRLEDIAAARRRPRGPEGAVQLRWEGDQYAHNSLSHVNRELCSRLVLQDDIDLEVHTREVDPDPLIASGVPDLLRRSTGFVLHQRPEVTVRHQWPPDWKPPVSGAWVVVQPWEFGALPQSWVDAVADADEVWCYTEWIRGCYELSGVSPEKLQVIPLGVDTDVFSPDGPRRALRTRKRTRFLFCGGAIARKGIDVLLNAYLDTFTDADDVCLVVKAHATNLHYRGQNHVELIREIAGRPGAPEIELIDEELSTADLADLYRSCQVLVHPYRGEGFALPVAEAMASGLPVIVTAGGATADFCDDTNSYAVDAQLVPVDEANAGPSSASYFWASPDTASLARRMTQVVADPVGAAERGRRGRQRILEGFTWSHAAERVAERLHVLRGRVPLRHRPVRSLDTRKARTLLHLHTATTRGQLPAAVRRASIDGACLVLPVLDAAAVDDFTTEVAGLLDEAHAPDDLEVLIVPCSPGDLVELRGQVTSCSDDVDPSGTRDGAGHDRPLEPTAAERSA